MPWILGCGRFFLSVYLLVPWFDAGILSTFEGLSGSLVLCFELSFSRLLVWSLVKTLALYVTIRAVVFIGNFGVDRFVWKIEFIFFGT